MPSPTRVWLLAVLGTALVLRLGWCLSRSTTLDAGLPDQREYYNLARNLLDRHEFGLMDPRFAQDVRAYRTPGYPLLLAACGGSIVAARCVQAILDTSTVLAVFLLARRWLPHGPGVLAAALVAINPFLIYFTALLLSETLFVSMLAWGMVLLAYRRNCVWGGCVLALSVLVRPSALLLPVVLGIGSVFLRPPECDAASAARERFGPPVGATMLLFTLAVLVPWAWRNYVVLGRWVWTTTNEGITRYDGFQPGATGASDQSFLNSLEFQHVGGMNELRRDDYFRELANRCIRTAMDKRPLWLLSLTGRKVVRTWSPIPLSSGYGGRLAYRLAGLSYSVPLFALAALGLWAGGLSRSAKVFLLLTAVYFTLLHAASVGSLRYRLPAEPILAVLAASGASSLWNALRRPEFKRSDGRAKPPPSRA